MDVLANLKKRNFWCSDDVFLEYYRILYARYIASPMADIGTTIIPKNLHFIWIGTAYCVIYKNDLNFIRERYSISIFDID